MKILLFALLVSSHAYASTPSEYLEFLNHSVDQRVAEFKNCKPQCYSFLSQVPFNPQFGLQTRWRAITTMGRLDSTHFRKELERALVSKEWFVRNAALIALQTDDRDHAVTWSTKLIADPALVVRTQAVRNLIQLDGREAGPILWQQIFSKNNFRGAESLWVRVHMAEALARFAKPGQAKYFQRLLMEPDERLYKWAVQGLETSTGFKMGDKDVPIEIRRQQWLARMGVQEI